MTRTEAKDKYAALRQGVPSEFSHDHLDWCEMKRLGSGSFCSVSSVPLKTTGERVAVKTHKKTESDGQWAEREIQILDQVTQNADQIPHVTHLLGSFRHETPTGEEADCIVQVCADVLASVASVRGLIRRCSLCTRSHCRMWCSQRVRASTSPRSRSMLDACSS